MELNIWGHSRPDEILKELHDWGTRVSHLIKLVARTTVTLQMLRELGDSKLMIKRYERLLAAHQRELDELLKTHGLTLQVPPTDKSVNRPATR